MANYTRQTYRPGFWCGFFWLLTWAGLFGGLAALWALPPECTGFWAAMLWGVAAVAAVVSTVIRSHEKNDFDGKKSLHWFD